MRSIHRITLVALVALALPGVAAAQRGDTLSRRGAGPAIGALTLLDRAPGETVLEHRAQLSLTTAQVAQIEQIRARVQTRNQPLVARLRTAGYPTTEAERDALTIGQLRTLRERAQDLAPTLREIRANQQAASREIQNLLTLEQYSRLRDLSREEMRAANPGRAGPRARPEFRGRAPVGPRGRGLR